MTFRRLSFAARTGAPLLALALLFAAAPVSGPALAGSPSQGQGTEESRRPGQIARDGAETLLRALDRFVAELPRYALPEINEQGDIIIRRKNPKAGQLGRESETNLNKAPVEI